MDSDAVGVDPGEGFEHLDSLHLILQLVDSAFAVDLLLEFKTPVLGSAVVLDIDYVAFLRHVHFPHADLAEPCVGDHL